MVCPFHREFLNHLRHLLSVGEAPTAAAACRDLSATSIRNVRRPPFLAHSYPSLRSIEAIGLNEQFSGMNEQVRRLFFLTVLSGELFAIFPA
jgi:hypothetical protein